jgi:hypothetical protein
VGLLLLPFFLLLLLAPLPALALDWKEEKISLSSNTAEEEVSAIFRYANSGAKPVRITEVKTGCDCATPRLSQELLLPGESGELRVQFRIGGRTGLQERHIEVSSSDLEGSAKRLTLVVDIQELLEVRPRLVFWKKGLPAEDKLVRLSLPLPADTRILSVETESTDFTCTLQTGDLARGLHQLSLRPLSTAQATQAQVLVHYEFKGRALSTRIFAAVR